MPRAVVLGCTAVLATSALSACSGGSGATADDGKGGGAPAPARISVNLSGEQAKAGKPVTVELAEGTLKRVAVRDGKGTALDGAVSPDGRRWTSTRPAAPGTSYTVEARDDKGGTAKQRFATAKPEKVNKLTLAPGKNATVGIAHPLSVVFDNPVKNKAEVERQLKVTTSNRTTGSWGWVKDYSGRDRVDWRPKTYWKPGTKATLKAELNGVDSGGAGGWFVRDYTTTLTVGRNQLVKVDLDAHRLTLLRDGAEVRTLPVSGGTPGGDKRSWGGTSVLMAKEGTINMRSETVGLGDAYDKMVDSSMRLTWSGMYAHAAPWNRAFLGRANHSSGCVGMGSEDAAWLFGQAQVGDPFEITGADTKGNPEAGNGYGAWNESWADWEGRSALR
ncbi:Ig-like domain-containing protein [Streptomyces sp. NPDC046887]|uniref:L,D-transpeptidase n=1 Tax=Streptomyces sp. NPDC046887 TaxID=3155472 RepID=UPI0033C9E93F